MSVPAAMEPVHDFARKLRQPSLWPRVVDYVAWQRAVRAAKAAGAAAPPMPAWAPLSINLDLTTACNYACTHCIDWDVLNTGVSHEEGRLRASMAEMRSRGLRSVILIGGGEPTIHPGFVGVRRGAEGPRSRRRGRQQRQSQRPPRRDRPAARAPRLAAALARRRDRRDVPAHAPPEEAADARRDLRRRRRDQGEEPGAARRLLVPDHVGGRDARARRRRSSRTSTRSPRPPAARATRASTTSRSSRSSCGGATARR